MMDRRRFVKVGAAAGAGLALAVSFQGCADEAAPAAPEDSFAPDAWIRIDPDGTVTVMVDRSEMGQGVSTALPMLVAEELDADWSKVRYQFAGANEAYYNPVMRVQATGGSTAVRAAWEPLRRAGATARAMLVAAAARGWGVPAAECETEPGVVVHRPSNRRAGYGSLVSAAREEPVPEAVALKAPENFRLIGTSPERLDLREKVTGRARFGADAGPPNSLVALVARCPVPGGRMVGFRPERALGVAGVRRVVPIETGVAVVADGFWAAKLGRDALEVDWDEGERAALDDAAVAGTLEALTAPGAGRLAKAVGDVAAAVAARTVEAVYQVPFLAHATMEPMNCTAQVAGGQVTVWVPTQFQAAPSFMAGGGTRGVAASVAGVPADRVTVHTTHLGGGFGRRSELDFVKEAVAVAKVVGEPVRLMWTREDDLRHDVYRPAARHVMAAALAPDGAPVSWIHRTASQSIFVKFLPGFVPGWAARIAGPLKGGIDASAVEGAIDHPYEVPNFEMRYGMAPAALPVGYWRSVAHTHTAFAVESFVDELAHAAQADPVAYRLRLLANAPRHRAVLELAATQAGWGSPPPSGRFRGVAVHESFGSFVAQVAEVEVDGTSIRVRRVVCAVDCGMVVHPDTVRAQMESGIVYGLSAALHGRITVAGGRVQQSNFHDYPVLRMAEMPVVETHIVPSGFEPGGVGEPATPPIAPAVANAVFSATGRRLRTLPLAL
ncbi:MAG: xanthine dehydrogenase family protein molybdopterin-binding subunit [Gemmatimonadetes bacterium]|nr:xanthine dehydrogenase family protein molybdopterin-binding subunit [Gemmatimonadota bacterium]